NVRLIATREIEDRSYIRAKPTREELARNLPCRDPLAQKDAKILDQPDTSIKAGIHSQEQLYWAKHDSDLDCYLTQYLPGGTAQSLYGQPANTVQQALPASQYPQPQYPQQLGPQPQYPLQQYPPSQFPPSQSVPPSED